MEEDSIKGLVILILTIGGGAALWIAILYWRLSVWKKEVIKERSAKNKLKRELDGRKAKETAAGKGDNELAGDIGDMLGDL